MSPIVRARQPAKLSVEALWHYISNLSILLSLPAYQLRDRKQTPTLHIMGTQADLIRMVDAFAGNLRACRKALGLTQEELAEVSGLSTNYIARLEIGASTPSFATLIKLSGALRVKASDLLAAEYELPVVSDVSTTIATLLSPLDDQESEFVLSQLRNSIRFALSHRKDSTSDK